FPAATGRFSARRRTFGASPRGCASGWCSLSRKTRLPASDLPDSSRRAILQYNFGFRMDGPVMDGPVNAEGASRAFPFGRYLDEFLEGDVYRHWPGKTITESDNNLFSLLTMNHHPLHLDARFAAESQHGQRLVVGTLVFSLVVGLTVRDISGRAIANL